MSEETKQSQLIAGPPLWEDEDPSGGWGLVFLIAILLVVTAASIWAWIAL